MTFLGDYVLLDGCFPHLDPHVGHDNALAIVSTRSDEFINLRCSFLKSKSIGLIN